MCGMKNHTESSGNLIPVFDVRQEDGKGRVKALHRNELLPFNSVPVGAIQEDQRDAVRGYLIGKRRPWQ